jgi:hypothetical protein
MSEAKKRPPYARYAFKNPYNFALLGGFASAALLTGNWWLGVVGAAGEALWMLFAPDSKLMRKLAWDKQFSEEQNLERARALAEKLRALPPAAAARCQALVLKQGAIQGLARDNPALGAEMLAQELTKLDDLVAAFIELASTCERYDVYLRSADVDGLERDLRRYRAAVEDRSGAPETRSLARKNLAVLEKRREKYAEIRRDLATATAQLDLIENTFRLLADQIVTMRSPQELGGQLDELMDGVEAIQQTTRETDRLLQSAT